MIAGGRKVNRRVTTKRPARRLWHVSPEGFGELRRSCVLSRQAAADFSLHAGARVPGVWGRQPREAAGRPGQCS